MQTNNDQSDTMTQMLNEVDSALTIFHAGKLGESSKRWFSSHPIFGYIFLSAASHERSLETMLVLQAC